ncbi:MAG TPA: GNAT family N-acetyltransferase [Ktedonobacteraceae bacterium]|nr:GNAT family N-acetyltransferase [Ktedonobacteraceae bacterium]
MTASSLIIRPPLTPDELKEHMEGYVQVNQAFSSDPWPADAAQQRLRRITTSPSYRLEQIRSAYRDGVQLGGYRIDERLLRIGAARLTTGCIGGVYTRTEYRNQGVATALMHDAIAYAQERDYPLLLLDGIPKFYYRYGFCDVYDLSTQELDLQAILALPPSAYTVRPSTLNDAASLLALYNRHFGPYTGSFERSIEQQLHWMQHLGPENLWLAIDPAGQVRGYLFLVATQERGQFFLAGTQIWELAVDDWPATVALLQYHIRQAESHGTFPPFHYSVPLTSPVVYWMVENLEVVDISTWDMPVLGWAVHNHTFQHRHAGWMARLVSLPALTRAMLPEWQARWQHSLAHWLGYLSLLVGDEAFTLRIAGTDLQLLDKPDISVNTLSLTPQAFIQAVFGYCPITTVVQQRLQPDEIFTVLTILFPTGQPWISASDWF